MCQSAITLVSKALPTIDNDERLLKIKGVIALFVQTMGVSIVQHQQTEGQAKMLTSSNRAGAILLIVSTGCSLRFSTSTRSY